MSAFPSVLGQTDLVNRWGYTRQGLDHVIKREADFPAPVAAINGGRNRIWLEADIATFEANHPELKLTPAAKPKRAASTSGKRRKTTKPPAAKTRSPKTSAWNSKHIVEDEELIPAPPPSRYRVAYRFTQKPPFAFREKMKRDGWSYVAKENLWIAIMKAGDLVGFDADLAPYSGKRIMTEAIE